MFSIWSKSLTNQSQVLEAYGAAREWNGVTEANRSTAHILFANPKEDHTEQTPE